MASSFTPPFLAQKESALNKWVLSFVERFPKQTDVRLIKGMHIILSGGTAASFTNRRSLSHLKRILLTQFFLQKKIEERLSDKPGGQILVRIFSVNALLCVAMIYPKEERPLKDQTILDVASQHVPALRKNSGSFYHWDSQDFPYSFCYLELEKMRGKDLLPHEIKDLETHLQKELPHHLSGSFRFLAL